jgi:hypothetical protein
VSCKLGWLFPVRALSVVFRAKFRDGLQQLFHRSQLRFPAAQPRLRESAVFARWLRRLCRSQWVVYTKRPFAGPQAVLAYLCRYTHRVAITNSRLKSLDLQNSTASFSYKDCVHGGKPASMTLGLSELLRRFCLHVLPSRFVKIRHYGLLSNRDRPAQITQVRELIAQAHPQPSTTKPSTTIQASLTIQHLEAPVLFCPRCWQRTLVLVGVINRPKAPLVCNTS